MRRNYPDWICSVCGHNYGRERPLLASYHIGGQCGWCGRDDVPVTEPRDFGYPEPLNVRRGRGPGKRPAMVHLTIRMPKHVLDHYHGDAKRMRDDWVKHIEGLINGTEA